MRSTASGKLEVIRDGLYIFLDFGNPSSFPVLDIDGKIYNCVREDIDIEYRTLSSDVDFSTKSLIFDGNVNEYIRLFNNLDSTSRYIKELSNFTVSFWVKFPISNGGTIAEEMVLYSNDTNEIRFGIFKNSGTGYNWYMNYHDFDDNDNRGTTILQGDTWYFMTFTMKKTNRWEYQMYLNNTSTTILKQFDLPFTLNNGGPMPSSDSYLMSDMNTSKYSKVYLQKVMIYDRTLTEKEIKQNYYATKFQFGI